VHPIVVGGDAHIAPHPQFAPKPKERDDVPAGHDMGIVPYNVTNKHLLRLKNNPAYQIHTKIGIFVLTKQQKQV